MLHSTLLCLLLCTHVSFGQTLADCTAFSSNGIAKSQYQYYRFYDFRRMKDAGPSNTSTNGSRSKIVTSASWKDDWYIRDYPRKSPGGYTIPVNYVPNKVYISMSHLAVSPTPLLSRRLHLHSLGLNIYSYRLCINTMLQLINLS